jgi:hypothetical protein
MDDMSAALWRDLTEALLARSRMLLEGGKALAPDDPRYEVVVLKWVLVDRDIRSMRGERVR